MVHLLVLLKSHTCGMIKLCFLLLFLAHAFNDAMLTTNLTAYYSFDGNANDVSGNNHHGVIHSATLTSDRFGSVNQAYYFNGIDAYIEILDGTSFNIVDEFSASVWIKSNTLSSARNIMSKSHGGGTGWLIERYPNSDTFWRNFYSNGGFYAGASVSIPDGVWCHLVVTKQGANYKAYVNGIQQFSVTAASASVKNNGNLPFTIGAYNAGNTQPASSLDEYFYGAMDEIRLYDRVLSTAEIAQLLEYQLPTSQPSGQPSIQPSSKPTTISLTSGLIAHFTFDGNADDSSGKGHNGVAHSTSPTTDRMDRLNQAYSFDGINSYVEVEDGTSFNLGNDFSVSLWVKPSFYSSGVRCIISKSHAANSGWLIERNSIGVTKWNHWRTGSSLYTGWGILTPQ